MSYPHRELADRPARHLIAWSLAAALLLLVAMAGPFLAGRVCTADDLGAFHLPLRAYYSEQLAQGESFDWMPQLFCGFYVTGEGQAGAYHPLHLLLYRLLPLQIAFAAELLFSYPLMMAGMWLFLRRVLGRGDVALAGGLLFTLCGFNLLHFVHPNAVAIVAHIPWLLWAIDIVLRDARRRSTAAATAGIALLTGSQLLLGYPQYVWFSLLAESAYAAFILTAYRYAPRSGCDLCVTCSDCVGCTTAMWPQLIIAKGIGLLIGGVQLVPTIEALTNSARQTSDSAFALWGSLHPLNLLQLVAPYLFANRVFGDSVHEFGVYVGAVPLMLVVWLAMRHRETARLTPLIVATAGFGLTALVLALGYYGGLYRLVAWLPLLNLFRFPCRYLLLFQLAVTVLASIGLLLLARESQQARLRRGAQPLDRRARHVAWRHFEPLWMAVAVSAAVAVVGIKLQSEPYIASIPAILIGPVLMGMAATLVVMAARGFPAALIGLVLLAVADQGWYGLSYSVYSSSAGLDEFAASANTPPSDGDGRVLATLLRTDQPGLRIGDRMTLSGWHRADGYAGLEPKQKLDYYHVASLRVAGVRWVQQTPSTKDIPGLTAHDAQWREVPAPLPRVRLVTETRGSLDPGNDLHRILPDRVALTDYTLALPPSTPGLAALTHDRPGRLEIDVETAAPQMLVIAESFHPGWQAAVDAQPRDLFRVDGDFMGCMVGPGKEHVVLTFRPASLRRGWLASLLGLSMLSLCFVGSRTATPPGFLKDLMS